MTSQNPTTSSSTLNKTVNKPKALPPASSPPPQKQPVKQFPELSLRAKTMLVAIAIGVIPVAVIGEIAYKVTESHVKRQINQTELHRTRHLAQTLEEYIKSRTREAETLAGSPIFTNPNVINTITLNQKQLALDTFQDQTGVYDSIVYLDLQGNPLFQSNSKFPLRRNYSDRPYFQQAIARKQTTMNELGISPLTGEPRMEFAVPVKNAWTDEVIGVIRFRIPSDNIRLLFTTYATKNEHWHLINTENIFFISSIENLLNQPVTKYYPQLQEAHVAKKIVTVSVHNSEILDQEQIVNYAPIKIGAINPQLNIGTAISLERDLAFAPLKPLKWIFLGGTIGTALLLGSISGFLANRIIQPLLKLTFAVDRLSQGKLDTRIELDRQDELGLLGNQINDMAKQLEITMERQKTIAKTSELMAKMSQSRSTRELQLPFSLFLAEIRRLIKADRLFFYQFDEQWKGIVTAESVAQDFPRLLGIEFDDPCFAKEYVRKYQRSRIHVVADLHQANLNECHIQLLEPYGIKASLVLPVILDRKTTCDSERLIGLLIANQCSSPRVWSQSDIDYLQQIAYQLEIVLRGCIYYQEDNAQKASIQRDLAQVLSGIKDIANGDLTVDLSSKVEQPNDFTKSFGTMIANMRQTIAQIKVPTQQINSDLSVSKGDLAELQDKLRQQGNQLVLIFAFIDQIVNSIAEVSSQVGSTSQTLNSVVTDIESEQANFSQAIAFMFQLESTLKDNTDKVKNLSNASQKMTRVIVSIRKINLRASLLVNKLSKRINDAEDSALGLKQEIESIQQSIAATKELENVVCNIDREISEVLREYEASENRLEQENYFLDYASNNLEEIAKTTKNAQQKLLSLINTTTTQVQTTKQISYLKSELDETVQSIHGLSDRTMESLDKTTITARDLENVIDFFKLDKKAN
ncbi:MAG: HAMP domain-containing protein [Pleurocapsa sp. MO_192.B19]|nr:HAMP domain-containing protein [Pleurocapsa sp. MO_192.B19]